MRSFFLLTAFVLLSIAGSFQVVISSDDLPDAIGSRYILHSIIPAPKMTIPNGLIWDFSALRISNSQAVNVISTLESPLRERFSESTICHSLGGGNYLFSKKTEKSLLKYGGIAKATEVVMTDPEEYFRFPLQEGQTWTDSFASTFSSQGIKFVRNGKLKGRVKGESILFMPYGSIQDVLWISLEEVISDTYEIMGSPMAQKTTNLIDCFVKAGNSEPLLTWTRILVDGEQVSSYLSYTDENHVAGKDNEGPWNSITIEQNAGQSNARLEFVSEWTGVMTLEYLKADGSVIESQELKTNPGLMTTDILLSNEGRYFRLNSQENSILIPLPSF